jgi:hypothetical protein
VRRLVRQERNRVLQRQDKARDSLANYMNLIHEACSRSCPRSRPNEAVMYRRNM